MLVSEANRINRQDGDDAVRQASPASYGYCRACEGKLTALA